MKNEVTDELIGAYWTVVECQRPRGKIQFQLVPFPSIPLESWPCLRCHFKEGEAGEHDPPRGQKKKAERNDFDRCIVVQLVGFLNCDPVFEEEALTRIKGTSHAKLEGISEQLFQDFFFKETNWGVLFLKFENDPSMSMASYFSVCLWHWALWMQEAPQSLQKHHLFTWLNLIGIHNHSSVGDLWTFDCLAVPFHVSSNYFLLCNKKSRFWTN